jgi:HEAT repeat protein
LKLDDLSILQTSDNSISPVQRHFAAARLLATRSDAARAQLVDVLSNGPVDSRIAVAEALTYDPWTIKDFIAALSAMLRRRDLSTVTAAADALGQYRDNADVLSDMIKVESSGSDSDLRQAIVGAMGDFSQKLAAQTLVDLLNHDTDQGVQNQAASALENMTGLKLGHDAGRWTSWFQQNSRLNENDFQTTIMRLRGDAYERQLSDKERLLHSSLDLLTRLYSRVPISERASALLSYLRSPAPEIRAFGASLVLSSALGSPNGAPPGTIEETRLLLGDPSFEVRAAAAHALSADSDSVPAMVAQLAVEKDDFVRIQLIKSLAIFQDPAALTEILKLIGPASSNAIRLEAANALRLGVQGGDVFNKNPALKQQIIDAVTSALPTTVGPGNQPLRVAIVNALAAIRDNNLYTNFSQLLNPRESVEVRAAALKGIGNMPDAQVAIALFDGNLNNETEPQMRLAAEEALAEVSQPIPALINDLIIRMSGDRDDRVKAEAWNVLITWAQSSAIDESALEDLATQLHTLSASKELYVRQQLRNRLSSDMNNQAFDETTRQKAAHDLANQESDIGDLLMLQVVQQPAQAAEHFQTALDYWQKNDGAPEIINPLCSKIVRAYLEAKRWDSAATFTSNYIKDVGNDPLRMPSIATISREFRQTSENLVSESTSDPNAYSDATTFFAAVAKMNPKLLQTDLDQLDSDFKTIQQDHDNLMATTRNSP